MALDRRQMLQLGTLIAGGWAVSSVLKRTAPIGRDVANPEALAAIFDDRRSPASGPPTASLRLAAFTDYRCPACRRAFPAMEEAILSDGDVRVIYKDWPIFGPPSERAAQVALASAEQGIYPAVHKQLMIDSRTISDSVLQDIVEKAGGNWKRMSAYLVSHDQQIMAQLRANGAQALTLGLAGTPGYLAGSVLVVGAIDKADFLRLFARARSSRK
ncbi:DsbA family protein [Sphingomonas sp. 179-I 2A4 NHS]|jgi:protein-disulfide isomerase|uniref:DsbA family protein n=2 Tax=Sphingomonadales TaxID=204457 RepID=UPI0008327AF2